MTKYYPGKFANFRWLLPRLCERAGLCNDPRAKVVAGLVEKLNIDMDSLYFLHDMEQYFTQEHLNFFRSNEPKRAELFGEIGRCFYDDFEKLIIPIYDEMVKLGYDEIQLRRV